jgi:hypothetical protein
MIEQWSEEESSHSLRRVALGSQAGALCGSSLIEGR